MDIQNMAYLFEKHQHEFRNFKKVENKLSHKKDLHAFMRLDALGYCEFESSTIIGSAGHDRIWLSIDTSEFAEKVTEDFIIELSRCGIWYDEELESLSMWT